MKVYFGVALLLLSNLLKAQTTIVDAKKVVARDSVVINGTTLTGGLINEFKQKVNTEALADTAAALRLSLNSGGSGVGIAALNGLHIDEQGIKGGGPLVDHHLIFYDYNSQMWEAEQAKTFVRMGDSVGAFSPGIRLSYSNPRTGIDNSYYIDEYQNVSAFLNEKRGTASMFMEGDAYMQMSIYGKTFSSAIIIDSADGVSVYGPLRLNVAFDYNSDPNEFSLLTKSHMNGRMGAVSLAQLGLLSGAGDGLHIDEQGKVALGGWIPDGEFVNVKKTTGQKQLVQYYGDLSNGPQWYNNIYDTVTYRSYSMFNQMTDLLMIQYDDDDRFHNTTYLDAKGTSCWFTADGSNLEASVNMSQEAIVTNCTNNSIGGLTQSRQDGATINFLTITDLDTLGKVFINYDETKAWMLSKRVPVQFSYPTNGSANADTGEVVLKVWGRAEGAPAITDQEYVTKAQLDAAVKGMSDAVELDMGNGVIGSVTFEDTADNRSGVILLNVAESVSLPADAILLRVGYANGYLNHVPPVVVLSPAQKNAARLQRTAGVYVVSGLTGFTVNLEAGTTLQPGSYGFSYVTRFYPQ